MDGQTDRQMTYHRVITVFCIASHSNNMTSSKHIIICEKLDQTEMPGAGDSQ